MSGQTNLDEVLKSLKISCDNIEYGFATVNGENINFDTRFIGVFRENEGQTIIAPAEYFQEKNIKFDGPFAKLTIEVHTSLQLVGLTALLTKRLTENNISANIVSGYYHDHIFVQYNLKDKAILTINSVKD